MSSNSSIKYNKSTEKNIVNAITLSNDNQNKINEIITKAMKNPESINNLNKNSEMESLLNKYNGLKTPDEKKNLLKKN